MMNVKISEKTYCSMRTAAAWYICVSLTVDSAGGLLAAYQIN